MPYVCMRQLGCIMNDVIAPAGHKQRGGQCDTPPCLDSTLMACGKQADAAEPACWHICNSPEASPPPSPPSPAAFEASNSSSARSLQPPAQNSSSTISQGFGQGPGVWTRVII